MLLRRVAEAMTHVSPGNVGAKAVLIRRGMEMIREDRWRTLALSGFGMAHDRRAEASSLMASRSCSDARNDFVPSSRLPIAQEILELIALIPLATCFAMAHEHRADALAGAVSGVTRAVTQCDAGCQAGCHAGCHAS